MSSKKEARASQPLELQAHALSDASAITFRPDGEKQSGGNGEVNCNEGRTLPEPSTQPIPQKWNYPRINIWKTFVTFLSFFIMGANDGVYGAILPYLESYYNLSYLVISLVFLAPIVGYVSCALLNNYIHVHYGQRGVAFIGPCAHVVSYIIISQHPPFPLLVVSFILAGFGNGLADSGWNAWLGDMPNANEILGFLHAFYGLGATVSPLIATSMIVKAHLGWYVFYYIMIGLAVVELASGTIAFWSATGKVYREANPVTDDRRGGKLRQAISSKITWILSAFLLTDVGIEVAVGGWVVTYMIDIRHAAPFAAGMSATGYWLGMTVGRVVLGFITPRIGEKWAILLYFTFSLGAHLIFWLVPIFPLSATAVAFEGFFLGPMFPAAVVAVAKLLPKDLHVGSIGFAAAFGASGGTILPFAVGAIAQVRGVQVLMPIVLAIMVAAMGIWSLLPGLKRERKSREDACLG